MRNRRTLLWIGGGVVGLVALVSVLVLLTLTARNMSDDLAPAFQREPVMREDLPDKLQGVPIAPGLEFDEGMTNSPLLSVIFAKMPRFEEHTVLVFRSATPFSDITGWYSERLEEASLEGREERNMVRFERPGGTLLLTQNQELMTGRLLMILSPEPEGVQK